MLRYVPCSPLRSDTLAAELQMCCPFPGNAGHVARRRDEGGVRGSEGRGWNRNTSTSSYHLVKKTLKHKHPHMHRHTRMGFISHKCIQSVCMLAVRYQYQYPRMQVTPCFCASNVSIIHPNRDAFEIFDAPLNPLRYEAVLLAMSWHCFKEHNQFPQYDTSVCLTF